MTQLDSIAQNIISHSDLLTVFGGRYPLESRIRKGVYTRLTRGNYMHTKNWDTLTPAQQHLATALAHAANNPDYIFSHTTAALMHGLPATQIPDTVHIYCPTRTRARDITVHHGTLHLPTETTVFTPGIRATSLERTLNDLATETTAPTAPGTWISL